MAASDGSLGALGIPLRQEQRPYQVLSFALPAKVESYCYASFVCLKYPYMRSQLSIDTTAESS